jgi:hypothetical protein
LQLLLDLPHDVVHLDDDGLWRHLLWWCRRQGRRPLCRQLLPWQLLPWSHRNEFERVYQRRRIAELPNQAVEELHALRGFTLGGRGQPSKGQLAQSLDPSPRFPTHPLHPAFHVGSEQRGLGLDRLADGALGRHVAHQHDHRHR